MISVQLFKIFEYFRIRPKCHVEYLYDFETIEGDSCLQSSVKSTAYETGTSIAHMIRTKDNCEIVVIF